MSLTINLNGGRMADKKTSALPEVTSAPDDAWLVIVVTNAKGIAVTSKIRKSNLLS